LNARKCEIFKFLNKLSIFFEFSENFYNFVAMNARGTYLHFDGNSIYISDYMYYGVIFAERERERERELIFKYLHFFIFRLNAFIVSPDIWELGKNNLESLAIAVPLR